MQVEIRRSESKKSKIIKMKPSQLQPNEFAPFYADYIKAVDEVDLLEGLENSMQDFDAFILQIPTEKHEYRYAEGKWTIKDIVQHLIDAERIFAYRALRIARKDQTPLPGFEENDYVDAAFANQRTLSELMEEFKLIRKTTFLLFKTFSDEQLLQTGTASEKPVSVRAIGFITIGHQMHHQKVIRERYL